MSSDQTWPDHWAPISRHRASDLLFEFLREADNSDPSRRHILRVIGECEATDDVVFEMKGWDAPYAVAHLQWQSSPSLGARLKALVGGGRRPEPPETAPSLHPVRSLEELRAHYPGS